MIKHFLGSIILAFLSILTVTGQSNALDLSGKWDFQIDREDTGVKEQWFRKILEDHINLPGSMPEKLKGDEVTVHTQWTGSLYDSSYYFNPYMEKYRMEGQVKLPFFLTPDKHYVGVAWYQKNVTIPSDWKGDRIILFLERPHIYLDGGATIADSDAYKAFLNVGQVFNQLARIFSGASSIINNINVIYKSVVELNNLLGGFIKK